MNYTDKQKSILAMLDKIMANGRNIYSFLSFSFIDKLIEEIDKQMEFKPKGDAK